MLVVIFIVMATVTSRSADAQTILAPGSGGGQVTLVGEYLLNLGIQLCGILSGKTANEEVVVNIIAHHLSVRVITFAIIGTTGGIGVTWNLVHITD